jgi:hypothetical protein
MIYIVKRMRLWTVFLALAALAACAAPANADLAVLSSGQVAKVVRYQVRGASMELWLPGGGSFTTPLDNVERIVADEVAPAPEIAETARRAGDGRYDLSFNPERRPLFGSEFDRLIEAECRKANLDAALVSAVIKAESNYDPRARSRKGAQGLMQLMPATARRLGVKRVFDPAANIRGGVAYLRQLVDRYDGRLDLTLAAYNAGEQAVAEYGGVPPYRETVEYVNRILGWWKPEIQVASASSLENGR